MLAPAAKALPVIDTRNSVKIKKVRIRFTISRSLPIKRGGHAGSHTASVGIINTPLKLVNAKPLSLLRYFRRKIDRNVHLDSDLIVLDAAIKLINTHLLCQFRRKVNCDVHFDPYFIVLPLWLEFLYQFRYFLWGFIFSGVI